MSRHHRHRNSNTNSKKEIPILLGQLCGRLYEPPYEFNHFDENNCREAINLGEIAYLRLCFVSGEYGRSEKRGILFQMKFGQEHQVNYCNHTQAEAEFNAIKEVIAYMV
jgi:hypothetical protein